MGARVIGFRPSRWGTNREVCEAVTGMANEAAALIGLPTRLDPDEVENYDDYVGEAYGVVTESGCEAVRVVAQTEGILLDPVYVGKAMAGLIDFVRTGRIGKDKTVVFVHTGGTPALFAYRDELVASGGYQIKILEK
jgi:1-aminocyclopropane-1-carboxylate deaminase/D-cysteine desulfhydrase-like pyridoxal-dependent ACC family enzyme